VGHFAWIRGLFGFTPNAKPVSFRTSSSPRCSSKFNESQPELGHTISLNMMGGGIVLTSQIKTTVIL